MPEKRPSPRALDLALFLSPTRPSPRKPPPLLLNLCPSPGSLKAREVSQKSHPAHPKLSIPHLNIMKAGGGPLATRISGAGPSGFIARATRNSLTVAYIALSK
jgi:hypothetical protein